MTRSDQRDTPGHPQEIPQHRQAGRTSEDPPGWIEIGRLRGDRARRVRDGDVLLAQPHRAHRPPRLVAGACGYNPGACHWLAHGHGRERRWLSNGERRSGVGPPASGRSHQVLSPVLSRRHVTGGCRQRHPPGPRRGDAVHRIGRHIPASDELVSDDPLGHEVTDSMPLNLIFEVRSAVERHETGHPARLNALNPGFHAVTADPRHVDCGAGGAAVTEVRFLAVLADHTKQAKRHCVTDWVVAVGHERRDDSRFDGVDAQVRRADRSSFSACRPAGIPGAGFVLAQEFEEVMT